MKRAVGAFSCVVMLGMAASLYAYALQEVPTVEEIMDKTHKVKKGLRDVITAEAMKPKPDFAKMQKDAAEFTKQISYLEKNDPPKGPKASWIALSKDYVKDAQAVEDAVKKKDAKAVLAAIKTQAKKCDECHDKHRP